VRNVNLNHNQGTSGLFAAGEANVLNANGKVILL
jgi:hypothetical protein